MSSVVIKFNTDNAAFDEENRNFEVSRILSKLASDIERGLQDESSIIRDINGNVIGSCEFFSKSLTTFARE